ncbi:serine phosphatase RsbU, regulator of sigma subunit [Bernardetia litoralis DSM 6794]|uniref:Serine phosphatase RsbU, regulator of sigma subunit n=2 Tax=Bernardetia litoralis TaxID=999 RepID=I4APJ0_BERLS|nr:serine phosphatase RsbU, regulator of sigma subunit [Bernardetia litoralis DSM 6794]
MVIFTGVTIYVFVDYESRKTLEKQITARIEKQSDYAIGNIDRFIYERVIDIQQLSQDPILSYQSISQAELTDRIKELQLKNDLMYRSISFFDPMRLRLADSRDLNIGKTHDLTTYWEKIDQGQQEFTMDISPSVSLNIPVMHFAAVVRNDMGERVGTVVTRAELSWINSIFEESIATDSLMRNADIDLLDKEGTILYSNTNPDGVLKEKYHDMEQLAYFADNEEEKNHLFGNKIYFYTRESGYESYAGNNWILLIALPEDAVYQPVYDLRKQIGITLALVILLAGLIAFIAARFFVKPILSLTASAKEMGEGNLEAIPNIKTRDEIGKLAQSFGQMANKLKSKMREQDESNIELAAINERVELKYIQINEQKVEIELSKDQIEMQNSALGEAFKEIEKQNKSITSSIHYAERIQRSILPEHDIFNKYFPHSFMLYKPRDIVSGDFYWFDEIEKDGKRHLVIAVGDCTGHGVPGGFMSMLGNNLLTTIVTVGGQIEPAIVLEEVDADIRKVLHQNEHSSNSQDGMEIAFCTIDLETLKMKYAGAHRALYFFRNGEFTEIKADRASLGGVSRIRKRKLTNLQLTTHEIQLQKDDIFYLFSDGYKDQFGGELGRVFSSKRFKNVLYKIHQKPMEHQMKILDEEIMAWSKISNQKQTDDIIVMGIRV